MGVSRLDKSVKNARVNLTFYILVLFVSFFSRDIFLRYLGEEFVGLTSTLSSVLGIINIAELGIGSAVGYMLYKPLFEGDQTKINEIISIFGYIYRKIGLIVVGLSLVVAPFLPLYFENSVISLPIVYFAYSSYIFASLLGYFINYKQLLLGADQRNYEITTYFQATNIVRILIQIAVAYYTKNLYLWIAIEIVFGGLYSIIISHRVKRVYPWLSANIKNGQTLLKKYPELIRHTKQIFVHKLSGAVLGNLSPLIIAYWSLSLAAIFNNYTLIVSKLFQLISHLLSSTDAGVGSVVAEGNKDMIKRIYWEMSSLYYLIAGSVIISMYFLIDPFITIWLGEQYVMEHTTVCLILFNLYIALIRISNDNFLYAHGLFSDVWAPITETVINISASIIGGMFFGINGVLVGSILSIILIVHIWKPYFLFSKGFKLPVREYWQNIFKYLILTLFVFAVMLFISKHITFDLKNNYLWWMLLGTMIFTCTFTLLWGVMLLTSSGMRAATKRVLNIIIKKLH